MAHNVSSTLSQRDSVLVIGATGALGMEVSKLLARCGFTMALMAREEEPLGQLSDTIVALGSPTPILLAADFARNDHVFTTMLNSIATRGHTLTGVVYCAVTLPEPTPLDLHPQQAWDYSVSANLRAPAVLLRALAPWVRANKSSHARCSPITQSDSSYTLPSKLPSNEHNPHQATESLPQKSLPLIFCTCQAHIHAPDTMAYWSTMATCWAGFEQMIKHYSQEMHAISSARTYLVDPGMFVSGTLRKMFPGIDHSTFAHADVPAHALAGLVVHHRQPLNNISDASLAQQLLSYAPPSDHYAHNHGVINIG